MRRIGLICLLFLVSIFWLCPSNLNAATERRVALVIGNEAYKDAPLRNPVSDATDMARALKEVGFEVTLKTNADRRAMLEAIENFSGQLGTAQVALFYFSGHGMQIKGRNYLLPTKYRISSEVDVELECIDTYRLLGRLEGRSQRVNIVILDACRNNPFARKFRSLNQGLSRLDAPTGTLLAYSTDPDNVAVDGLGRNSPYTAALIKYIKTPGLTVEQAFKRVRAEVIRRTGGKQTPWESTSLVNDFYFASTGPVGAVSSAISKPPTAMPPQTGDIQDYDDVIKNRKQAEAKWSDWQSRMELAYGKAERYDQSPRLKPEEKVSAWTSFLSAFGDDNPFSVQDESMRAKARERVSYWRKQKETSQVAMAHRPSGGDRTYTNSLGMKFVLIPAGSFLMGSKLSAEEVDRKFPGGKLEWYQREHPRHAVKISKPFYLQSTEVTVGQWREFVLATGYRTEAEKEGWSYAWKDGMWGKQDGVYWDNPGFSQSDNHPVICVSWNDAQAFVTWLNGKEGTNTYRLPTEAEWEYACRAGTSSVFFWGDDPDKACRYANVADQTTWEGKQWNNKFECEDGYWFPSPTAGFQPNPWGLYDMIGNVWEWCGDWYGGYPSGSVTDPAGPSSGSVRVVRGGGWDNNAGNCRSAFRHGDDPGNRFCNLGFRLARTQ